MRYRQIKSSPGILAYPTQLTTLPVFKTKTVTIQKEQTQIRRPELPAPIPMSQNLRYRKVNPLTRKNIFEFKDQIEITNTTQSQIEQQSTELQINFEPIQQYTNLNTKIHEHTLRFLFEPKLYSSQMQTNTKQYISILVQHRLFIKNYPQSKRNNLQTQNETEFPLVLVFRSFNKTPINQKITQTSKLNCKQTKNSSIPQRNINSNKLYIEPKLGNRINLNNSIKKEQNTNSYKTYLEQATQAINVNNIIIDHYQIQQQASNQKPQRIFIAPKDPKTAFVLKQVQWKPMETVFRKEETVIVTRITHDQKAKHKHIIYARDLRTRPQPEITMQESLITPSINIINIKCSRIDNKIVDQLMIECKNQVVCRECMYGIKLLKDNGESSQSMSELDALKSRESQTILGMLEKQPTEDQNQLKLVVLNNQSIEEQVHNQQIDIEQNIQQTDILSCSNEQSEEHILDQTLDIENKAQTNQQNSLIEQLDYKIITLQYSEIDIELLQQITPTQITITQDNYYMLEIKQSNEDTQKDTEEIENQ
ncbi:Hypothetical_protein [Hexamita inflata]|uniref:Hypothetical_protein n=1 Tax=Hexamita inflata TaxID=28002 RepID=A0ABP1IL92_9EUKA